MLRCTWLGEAVLEQLASGDVDRDRHGATAVGLDARALHVQTHLVHDPLADGHDEPGLLGDANELARRDQTTFGMLPPQQGLDGNPLIGDEVELGLELHAELVVDERRSQLALGEEALHRLGVHHLVEELESSAAAPLGAVHRCVGVAQQVGSSTGRLVGDRDPDARRHHQLGAVECDRTSQGLERALRQLDRLLVVFELLADDHELVTAEPRHRVVATHHSREPTPDRDEEIVTCLVAETVVHHLEPIEVEEQHGELLVVLGEGHQCAFEALDAERTIGQRGEGVVQREETELLGVRDAIEGEAGEIARSFQERRLLHRRRAHAARVDAEEAERSPAVT